MTVVLDTNVVISGIFWSGPPGQILKHWQANKFRLALSLPIIDEYRRVGAEIGRKFPHVNIDGIFDSIAFNSDIYVTEDPPEPICTDPDNDKFLICAIAAKAQYIVTGDKALLALNGY